MKFLLYACTFFSLTTPAFSYIDPGTGGFIIQMILGFIAAVITGVSFYWQKFKGLLKKIFYKKKIKN